MTPSGSRVGYLISSGNSDVPPTIKINHVDEPEELNKHTQAALIEIDNLRRWVFTIEQERP
jgi:hypothetical protein